MTQGALSAGGDWGRALAHRRAASILAIAAAAILLTPSGGRAAHSNALWRVVHGLCVRDRTVLGLSAPCIKVDLQAGYAVVPDPKKRFHLLLVPTRRLTGIEDPALLEREAINYWRPAWAARRYLEARLGRSLPRAAVGLAVNGIAGRSQEQLHIHISCIRPEVAATLGALQGRITAHWSRQSILGWRWRVRSLSGTDLGIQDPFKLLAQSGEAASAHMGDQTLVVVGADLPSGEGFYVLARGTETDEIDPAHGEALLDERCGEYQDR